MKDVRLIASDMDHTLLTGRGELPPGFHEVVARLNAAGIVFVAASGRPVVTLRGMFPQGGPGIAYIGDNGGMVVHDGEVLFKSLIAPTAYHDILLRTLRQTSGVPVICAVEAGFAMAAHRRYEDVLRIFYSKLEFVDDLTAIAPEVVKMSTYFPDADARVQHDQVFNPAYGGDFSVTIGGPTWVDIMNRGVTKGSSLLRLAEHLGIDADHMMAFGDTLNDLEMLDAVRYSYAVSNADAIVRERARHLTGSNDEHGVVRVIEGVLAHHRTN